MVTRRRTKSEPRKEPKASSRGLPITSIDKLITDDDDDRMLEHWEGLLQINRDALEEERQKHPELFYSISRKLALQVSRRDASKTYLTDVEARVDATLRRAARERDEKITENEIRSKKQAHADVVEARNMHLRLCHSVNQWGAMKDAWNNRSYALRDLIELHIHHYYGASMQGTTPQLLETKHDDDRKAMANRRRRANQRDSS